MRVAFIINDLSGGGAEKAVTLLSQFLVDRHATVRVLTLQHSRDGYTLDPRVERRSLRSGIIGNGVGRLLALPIQAYELAHELRGWLPDVCVSFLPRSNFAHVMTRWFGNRRPILVTEQNSSHDTYPTAAPRDLVMRAMMRWLYPKADAVFASSKGVLEGLISFGVERHRMTVVYNAVRLCEIEEKVREQPPPLQPRGRPVVITVGRHAPQKDHATLLRAVAEVRKRLDIELILLGEGPQQSDLERLALSLGIADAVSFVGWQDNPFAWMAAADVFVLSSRFEGFGNVLVEAMACGVPVISTDCPSGPREILANGEAGILTPVGDVVALSSAIADVLTDASLRESMVTQARLRAPQFDISLIGEEYETLLRAYLPAAERPEWGQSGELND